MEKISRQTKENIILLYLGEYSIPKGSMLKNGVKINKRKMIGKHQTSSREPLIWCFATESKRFLRSRTEFSLVPVFNTKGADVAYLTYMDMCVTT